MAFFDSPFKYATAPGLNIVCSALSDAKTLSANSNHKNSIQVVHDARDAHGFLTGWQTLSTHYPTVSLNPLFLDDINKCMKVYKRIHPGAAQANTYFQMTISNDPGQNLLDKVPPKVIGGTSWTRNHEYKEIQRDWLNVDFPPMPPVITFGWPCIQRKAISRNDLYDCDTLMLLTTVDYDVDRHKDFHPAFSHALAVGKRCVSEVNTRMQSAALVALLGFDVQVNVRTVQESWVAHGAVGGNSRFSE